MTRFRTAGHITSGWRGMRRFAPAYRGAGEKAVGSEAQPINAVGDRHAGACSSPAPRCPLVPRGHRSG